MTKSEKCKPKEYHNEPKEFEELLFYFMHYRGMDKRTARRKAERIIRKKSKESQ